MKRKRYSDEQIAFALRQTENGTLVEEVCRKLGVSEATFYRWKKQFAGMGVVEIRRLKQLEEEIAEMSWLIFGWPTISASGGPARRLGSSAHLRDTDPPAIRRQRCASG